MGFLYQLTSPSGKRYIGVTVKSVPTRCGQHASNAKNRPSTILHHAIRKYGLEAFMVTTLAILENDQLKDTEIRAIAKLRPEYNMTEGGDGTGALAHTPEANAKRSRSMREVWLDEEFKKMNSAAISNAKKGRPLTDEHRAALSAAAKRRWAEGKNVTGSMASLNSGRNWTRERRDKQSEASRKSWERRKAN